MAAPFPIREHRLTRRVQFYETDAAGIVHFSWYPRYMEEAEHAMWRAAGLSIHEAGGEHGWPRVAITFDYVAPLRFEDVFDVTIRVAELGTRSLRYACDMTRGDTRIATGSMTIVCVTHGDDGQVRAAPLPPAITSRFAVAESQS